MSQEHATRAAIRKEAQRQRVRAKVSWGRPGEMGRVKNTKLQRLELSLGEGCYFSLVGALEHFLFSHILGIIIPTDEYFSQELKPPTSFSLWGFLSHDGPPLVIIHFG